MALLYRLPRPQSLAEAWTLLAVQAEELATLRAENGRLRTELDGLRTEHTAVGAELRTLRAQVQALTARLGQNSSNASRPPSSDPPNRPPRPPRAPAGRPPGGQPGHVGHGRPLRPPDQVDHVVAARPVAGAACGTLLLGEDWN